MFNWTHVEKMAFDYIERIVVHDALFEYPNFDRQCDIHKNASD